jgi:GT2 family glycosyltransferase
MKLSISIVNWNTKEILRKCLNSLYKNTFKDFEIFVVDNDSSDGSAEMIRQEFPQTNLIANTQNTGFAKANNQAIKLSAGEYILVLNPDIIVFQDTLKKMITYIENNNDIGALGIKLLNENSTEIKKGYFRKYPSLRQTFLFYTMLENLSLRSKWLKNKFWEKTDTSQITTIEQIPGACLLLRRKTIDEIGLFDERFGLFFEDVDLCYRINKSHWKIYFNPEIEAIHIGAQSIGLLNYTELATKFFTSMHLYLKKHHSSIKAIITKYIVILNTMLKVFIFKSLYIFSNYNRTKRKEHINMLMCIIKNLWKI